MHASHFSRISPPPLSSTHAPHCFGGPALPFKPTSPLPTANCPFLPPSLLTLHPTTYTSRPTCLRPHVFSVVAIDEPQHFDFHPLQQRELEPGRKLKIGLVGFGNFGQFLAERFAKQGHTVLAHSRADYHDLARSKGVTFFRDPHDFCEEHPEVIVMCTSILSIESVLQSLPLHRLKRNTLFVDVLSVKQFPRELFLQVLPSEFDVLCTHPMFGPQSGKESWAGLPFVYEKVRVGEGARAERCTNLLNIFASEGCRMLEMCCAEHDRYAASSQFITHTLGRVLGKLGLESTPINTKGYETLLNLVDNIAGDSFDLYYGLFMYNLNATEELDRLELAFDAVKKQLFGQLHDVFRKQLFEGAVVAEAFPTPVGTVENTKMVSAEFAKLRKATARSERQPVNGRITI